ncbi:MAG: PEP-CTERM sorting domain-containing protein, partial [Planctomycetes bacterium]|nr:PEP-CTERM sorting domain-containing protein [Planctomycetota bacterium]
GDLNVSDTPNSQGTLYLDGGLVRGNIVFIGKAGGTKGVVQQTGGELRSNAYFNIGTAGGSVGEYHLDGGTLWASSDLNVSDQGNSTGTLYLNDGMARGQNVYVGKSAGTLGTVVQNGGQMVANGDLHIASNDTSTGNYTLNDGQIIVNGGVLHVGDRGTGTLTQTGGGITTANWFVIGQGGNKTSVYNMSGGTLDVNTNGGGEKFQIGVWDTVNANFNVGGDAQVNVHNSMLQVGGDHGGAQGQVTQGGTSTLRAVDGANVVVGWTGPGTYTLEGSALLQTPQLVLAQNGGSTGTFNLQGDGTLEANQITQGGGSANFNMTGGTLRTTQVTFALTNSGGTLDVGGITSPGLIRTWYDGNAPTDTVPPENWNSAADPNFWDADIDGDTNWGGGDQPPKGVPNLGVGGGDAWDYYSLVYTGQFHVPSTGTVAFREEVDDSVAMFVDGTRILWDFEDTGTIDGTPGSPWTTHTEGSIALTEGWHNIEIRLADHWGGQGGPVLWDPAGGTAWQTLAGSTLRTNRDDGIGTTLVNGDYTQEAAGTLLIDVDAATMEADKLIVTGTLNAGGTLDVSLVDDLLPPFGSTFDILDFTDVGSEFDAFVNSPLPPAVYWDLSNLYTTGEITLAVPEPTTGALALLGGLAMAAMAVVRRRRWR